MTNIETLLQNRQNQFIASRRDVEIFISNFFSEIAKIDPKLLAAVQLPVQKDAKAIFPSLYADPFNEEAYEKEYTEFSALYGKIKKIGEVLNAKAEEVLKG